MPDQERIYIGNVVLDESNQEMLKQWLLDIIKSLQGHGRGFDADTVDGFHADAFATAEQGRKADTALQSGILIGSSPIYNIPDAQYIKTDGVKIDSIVYDNLIAYIKTMEEDMLLSDFLVLLYFNYTERLNELDEKKVDKIPGKGLSTEDFTTRHKEIVEDIALAYEDILCPKDGNPSQQVVKRVLNAGSVNHLQFILTTESIYAQYTNEVKTAWNNIFIFVEEDAYPSDYESPLDCPIETGYVFRIDDNNDSRPGEVWLQYKGRLAKNWIDMVRINDLYAQFLQYGNFKAIMKEIAEEIVNAAIAEIDTPEHLNSLIVRMEAPGIDDWKSYPFWSREVDFVYDVVNGDHSFCSKNSDGFMIADIGDLTTDIEQDLSGLQNSFNSLSSLVNTINSSYIKKADVQNQVNTSSLPPSSNAVKNSIDNLATQCNNLAGQINTLNTAISNLQTLTNRMRYFQKYMILGVSRYKGRNNSNFVTPTDQKQDTLGAYDIQGTNVGSYGDIVPEQARFAVSNKGHATNRVDPDRIYARVIQEHTGEPASYNYDRWVFFQINGTFYARKIHPGTDYAELNINLMPGTYVLTALYIDTMQNYQHPIFVTQELLVEDIY